ncbi:hypothetical protein ACETRX_33540, partial [Labrys portucalensis]
AAAILNQFSPDLGIGRFNQKSLCSSAYGRPVRLRNPYNNASPLTSVICDHKIGITFFRKRAS